MTTTELPRPLSPSDPEADNDAHPYNPGDANAQKRLRIAAFMDSHPDVFAAPEAAVTWTEFVEQNCVPQGRDQLTLDMAIGRLIQVMRTAQEGIPERADLAEMLRQAEQGDDAQIEPDARVQSLASQDAAPEDVQVMARAMSLYKNCMAEGIASGDEISNAIHAGFDHVPATSPFMRSLIDTAKEVTLIDVRFALGLSS